MWWLWAALALGQDGTELAAEADLHFRIGVEAFRDGHYRDALEHLLLSNRLVPNKNVRFNIGLAYERLDDYAEAFGHYSESLRVETDPEARAKAERALERIAPKVALAAVTTTPPGATVYVDRRDLGGRGASPRSLALPPGEHTLILELDGYRTATATVTVATGSEAPVAVTLERILGTVDASGLAGAEIRTGSETGPIIGVVPGQIRLPPGNHVLVSTAPGYAPSPQVVEVRADETVELDVALEVLTGSVVVDAAERDALITVDGVPAGFTPAVVEVPVGTHALVVSRDGFRPYETEVTLGAGDRIAVDARLRSLREVTAASRVRQDSETAPASVSVITGEELRAFGYTSVYDALGGTRGVFQTNDLTYQYLGFRGYGRPGDYGNRVLLTVDGHAINDDQLGASYVAADLVPDLGDVAQIEVVRGPGSALYGTNAFLGVVNVVTRDEAGPELQVTASDGRTVRGHATVGTGKVYATVGALASQGRDYVFPELTRHGGVSTGADAASAGHVHLKGAWRDLSVTGWATTRFKHIPTGAFATRLGDHRTITEDTRGFAEARYEPALGRSARLYARAYVDHYRFRGNYAYGPRYLVADRWVGTWLGVEPRLVVDPTEWLSLTAGAEARASVSARLAAYDVYDGDATPVPEGAAQYLDERPAQQVYSGYALAEARVKWLSASVGARYDHFTLQDIGSFNPRVALVAEPRDGDVVKLLAGTAFRAPSPYELYYNDDGYTQVRPEALSPERIATIEAEISHRFDDVTTLTGAVYHNSIDRLVVLRLTGDTGVQGADLFQYANADRTTRTVGGEVELRREWRSGFMLAACWSAQRTRVGDWIDGRAITNSPEHVGSLKIAVPVRSTVTAASRFVLESPRETFGGSRTDWGATWDVTFGGDLDRTPLTWGVGVRNLLDWQVGHPSGPDLVQQDVPQPGRSLYASLTLRR